MLSLDEAKASFAELLAEVATSDATHTADFLNYVDSVVQRQRAELRKARPQRVRKRTHPYVQAGAHSAPGKRDAAAREGRPLDDDAPAKSSVRWASTGVEDKKEANEARQPDSDDGGDDEPSEIEPHALSPQERDTLLRSPSSPLVGLDLKDVVNARAFGRLSGTERNALLPLLPDCDRKSEFTVFSLFRSTHFAQSLRLFQHLLEHGKLANDVPLDDLVPPGVYAGASLLSHTSFLPAAAEQMPSITRETLRQAPDQFIFHEDEDVAAQGRPYVSSSSNGVHGDTATDKISRRGENGPSATTARGKVQRGAKEENEEEEGAIDILHRKTESLSFSLISGHVHMSHM